MYGTHWFLEFIAAEFIQDLKSAQLLIKLFGLTIRIYILYVLKTENLKQTHWHVHTKIQWTSCKNENYKQIHIPVDISL